MNIRIALIALIAAFGVGTSASAEEPRPQPWYMQADKPETLKAALAADEEFVGKDNVGFSMQGDAKLCATLKKIKLPCDYNTRMTISIFLTVNGKGLFPASGGTNPYVSEASDDYPDDAFIGRPVQNTMLRQALEKNADLFKGGDLTAEMVSQNWR